MSPQEPRVTLQVGGQPVNFLVDMGANYSVFQNTQGPLSKEKALILLSLDPSQNY